MGRQKQVVLYTLVSQTELLGEMLTKSSKLYLQDMVVSTS